MNILVEKSLLGYLAAPLVLQWEAIGAFRHHGSTTASTVSRLAKRAGLQRDALQHLISLSLACGVLATEHTGRYRWLEAAAFRSPFLHTLQDSAAGLPAATATLHSVLEQQADRVDATWAFYAGMLAIPRLVAHYGREVPAEWQGLLHKLSLLDDSEAWSADARLLCESGLLAGLVHRHENLAAYFPATYPRHMAGAPNPLLPGAGLEARLARISAEQGATGLLSWPPSTPAQERDSDTLLQTLSKLVEVNPGSVVLLSCWHALSDLPCMARDGQLRQALIQLDACAKYEPAQRFMARLASTGWFDRQPAIRVPEDSHCPIASVHCLERRGYCVRAADNADLPRLLELEQRCWAHTRMNEKRLRQRIKRCPAEQLVLEEHGQLVAVLYTQRIRDIALLDTASAEHVHKLHDPEGNILQLLALNVDPDWQNRGYGDQLLEYGLQWATLAADIHQVIGVTVCKNFAASDSDDFAAYIQRTGTRQDPVLAFHAAHGATIVKALAGYRPEDAANQHHGVLVSYPDLTARVARKYRVATSGVQVSGAVPKPSLPAFLRSVTEALLGARRAAFAVDRPFMEMGLDSADLLSLQLQVEKWFGAKLESGFFFEFSNCDRVARELLQRLQTTSVSGRDRVSSGRPTATSRSVCAVDGPVTTGAGDIAVIGMACKLPGGLDTPEAFWRCLRNGEHVIGEYPAERDSGQLWRELGEIRRGGFMQDADAFDAALFRMTPAEALITDPQQRLLLELSWTCLEHAGLLPATLAGSDTGVFVGASNRDYAHLMQTYSVEPPAHYATGSALSILANRISYFFDFTGPSLVIDTACSASLVALHTAIRALRQGECESALVGAANLICHPDLSRAYHKAGMLAPDGLCKVFDASANGYVRSEGAVMLLLKPLQKALDDGDRIEAVIRGSAINHGGLASGLTVPSPRKQADLLLAAWRDAGLSGKDIHFLECHGTGTSLGDPIEIQGILAANNSLPEDARLHACWIGSVKSNLGHLEPAAGLTGLLKAILALQHRCLPRTLHCARLNGKIDLGDSGLAVATQEVSWPEETRLVAGVSSFGSGGSNAHVVVAQAPPTSPAEGVVETAVESLVLPLLLLSAQDAATLRKYAQKLVTWLQAAPPSVELTALLAVYQHCRTPMQYRLAVRAESHAALLRRLEAWLGSSVSSEDGIWAHADSVHRPGAGPVHTEDSLAALAVGWVAGQSLPADLRPATRIERIAVPTYPFARQRFWIEPPDCHFKAALPCISNTSASATVARITWEALTEAEVYRQGQFCCLGLGAVVNQMLALFRRCNPAANTCVISDFAYFPLPVQVGDYLACQLNYRLQEQLLQVDIRHGVDGENGSIAVAKLTAPAVSPGVAVPPPSAKNALLLPAMANRLFPLMVGKLTRSVTLQRMVFSDLQRLPMASLIVCEANRLSLRGPDQRELLRIVTEGAAA